jgi:hypothetical protein
MKSVCLLLLFNLFLIASLKNVEGLANNLKNEKPKKVQKLEKIEKIEKIEKLELSKPKKITSQVVNIICLAEKCINCVEKSDKICEKCAVGYALHDGKCYSKKINFFCFFLNLIFLF